MEAELKELGGNHLNGDIQFESPVSDFADLEVDDRLPTEDEVDDNGRERTAEPELGVFDYAERADENLSEFMEDINLVITNTRTLAKDIQEKAEELQGMAGSPGQVSPKRANRIARDAANKINDYADLIEEKIDPMDEKLNFMIDAVQKVVEFSDETNPEHRKKLIEHREGLKELINESESTIDSLRAFESEASSLGGINRELTKASNHLSDTLQSLINILAESSAKAERVISLIEQKI